MIPELAWAFVTGLAGSLHCLGMCGPLTVAYALHLRTADPSRIPAASGRGRLGGLARHFTFHMGRIVVYAVMGALAAGLVRLGDMTGSLMGVRNGAALTGGLFMIFFGLVLLKVVPFPFVSRETSSGGSMVTRLICTRLKSPGRGTGLVLGMATGFLPCMLSWAMVIKAALTEDPFTAFVFMILFGLGTVPLLLLVGVSASLFTRSMRLAGERLAALSVMAMGVILVWKGISHLV